MMAKENSMKKIGAEFILGVMLIPWVAWATVSIVNASTKVERVIAVEEKVDYIYKYLIEKGKNNKE